MRRTPLLLLLAASLASAPALADNVVASDHVKSQLLVRRSAGGPVIGGIRPGERVPLVATRGGWHEVALSEGRVGFVSTAWSRVEPEPTSTAPATAHLE